MTQIAYRRKPPVSLTRAHWAIRPVLGVLSVAGVLLLSALLFFDVRESERDLVVIGVMFFLILPLFAGFAALFSKLANSLGRDLLQLDDGGLGWKTTSTDRRWRWRELSAFEVYRRRPGQGFIWFSVPEDESQPGLHRRIYRVAQGRSEVRIRDIYERPLDEIAAELNARRLGALEEADAASEGRGATDALRAERGSEVTYLADTGFGTGQRRNPDFTSKILAVLIIVILGLDLVTDDSLFAAQALILLLLILVLSLTLPLIVAWRVFPTMPPMDNTLRLDADGVTITRRGKGRRWSWGETSAFRRRGTARLASKFFWGSLVTVEVPDDARQSALWRWLCKRLFGRPLAVIADIYLAPLDDIAAKLDECRARAVGTGDASPGPGAPA